MPSFIPCPYKVLLGCIGEGSGETKQAETPGLWVEGGEIGVALVADMNHFPPPPPSPFSPFQPFLLFLLLLPLFLLSLASLPPPG